MAQRGRPFGGSPSTEEAKQKAIKAFEENKSLIERLIYERLEDRMIAKQLSVKTGTNISERMVKEYRFKLQTAG